MKTDNPAKHFILPFLIALVLYAAAYSWIEHRRNRKGPWEVTFTNGIAGPGLVINQARLGLTNVQIIFPGEAATLTNTGSRMSFGRPREVPFELPFGKCVFMDLTFLPGTLTIDAFGHEIELLPRVLVVDRKERGWRTGESVTLERVTGKKPELP
jgi:hypothetical protein